MEIVQTKYPIVIIGGWLSAPGDYSGMARLLAQPPYGRVVYITDIRRHEWASLRDPDFRPVMDILARTVELVLQETSAEQVEVIGHSAGGRVARAYLGDRPYYGRVYDGHTRVASLTTLGTAHLTWEVYVAKFGQFVNDTYPGAYFDHVTYRSIGGESVRGRRWGTLEQMFAFRSYQLVCNDGEVIGDGVVPAASCYLSGAENLILSGVRHAPYNAPRTWYGAPEVVRMWFGSQDCQDTIGSVHLSSVR